MERCDCIHYIHIYQIHGVYIGNRSTRAVYGKTNTMQVNEQNNNKIQAQDIKATWKRVRMKLLVLEYVSFECCGIDNWKLAIFVSRIGVTEVHKKTRVK